MAECGMIGLLGGPKRQKRDGAHDVHSSSNHEFMGVNNAPIAHGEDSSRNYLTAADFDAPCNRGLSPSPPPTSVDAAKYARDMARRTESVEAMPSRRLYSSSKQKRKRTREGGRKKHMKVDGKA